MIQTNNEHNDNKSGYSCTHDSANELSFWISLYTSEEQMESPRLPSAYISKFDQSEKE